MEINISLIIGLFFLSFVFFVLAAFSSSMTNSDNDIYFLIYLVCFFVTLIISFVLLFIKSKKNGATLMQYLFGKGITSVCTTNGMCASNKCVNSFCVL